MNLGLICMGLTALSAGFNGSVVSAEKLDKSATVTIVSKTGEKVVQKLSEDGSFKFEPMDSGVYEVKISVKKKQVTYPTLLLEDGSNVVTLYWPKSLDNKERSDQVAANFQAGMDKLRGGEYTSAISDFRNGLAYDGSQSALWGSLSLAEVGAGKLQDALISGMMALRLSPAEASYRNNVGTILHRLGKFSDAAKRHEEAAALNPEGKGLYLSNAAASYLTGGMDQKALSAYKAALEDINVPATSWYHAGVLANRLGEQDTAKSYLNKYLAAAPTGEFVERARTILRYMGG